MFFEEIHRGQLNVESLNGRSVNTKVLIYLLTRLTRQRFDDIHHHRYFQLPLVQNGWQSTFVRRGGLQHHLRLNRLGSGHWRFVTAFPPQAITAREGVIDSGTGLWSRSGRGNEGL